MRQIFVPSDVMMSKKSITENYPWAEKIVKVCGGHQVFESTADYVTWAKQK